MKSKLERLNEVYNFLRSQGKCHTQKELAQKIGANGVSVSRAFAGNEEYLTDSFLERILENFDTNYNPTWLLSGEGAMLKTATETKDDLDTNETEQNYVLQIPLKAQGGSLNDFTLSVMEYDCEKILSPIKNVDFAMIVSGDSMAPEYPSGSQILIKKINEKAFIDWGRVFVLDTCNGIVIKKIFPSKEEGFIECRSINPEYPSFDIDTEDIYGYYRVLLCMSVK